MKLSFHGAAQTVTGTKHLVTHEDGTKILLDCGMFQGMGHRTYELNSNFGFDATSINAVVLSHAHIDHSGLLPKLVKDGFSGKIFCTAATRELTEILLIDSAAIQLHEAEHSHAEGKSANGTPHEPLYDLEDVQSTFRLFEEKNYGEPFEVMPGITAVLTNTGHLIGSASIHLTIKEKAKTHTLLFSGDVGRYRGTLLKCPQNFPAADHIILEATYGNSMHGLPGSAVDPLLKKITEVCVQKKGKLIIPAFSVGRTQELLFALNQLELEKRLPQVPYFVDSPLSKKATALMKDHLPHFNERLQEVLKTDEDPFHFEGLKYVDTPDDSRTLSTYEEPCVIISASGTADAGRVKRHIFSVLKDKKHSVLFVGFCQESSTGGQLLRGAKMIELFGDECEVRADIDSLSAMSAHGDADDLLNFLSCQPAESVKDIYLVHGELATQQAFADRLKAKGYANVVIPAMHDEFEL